MKWGGASMWRLAPPETARNFVAASHYRLSLGFLCTIGNGRGLRERRINEAPLASGEISLPT